MGLAIENLKQAITLNAKYKEMAKTEPDLDAIREDERFKPNLGVLDAFSTRRCALAEADAPEGGSFQDLRKNRQKA